MHEKALDGSFLTLHPVFVTNCIIVKGYSEATTIGSLEFYFDNKKKSGVNGVTDIKMNTNENYCIIYFEDPIDALIACERSNVLNYCNLQVQIFYECLGLPADEGGYKFKLPLPITIENSDIRKLAFFLNSKPNKEALEEQLQAEHATIVWPTDESKSLTIECNLTIDTNDFNLTRSWEHNTRKQISKFMDKLCIEEHFILQEAWLSVVEKIREINIFNSDDVGVKFEKHNCKISLVGHTIPVKELSETIKVIIAEVINDLSIKKLQVQENIQLKRHQLLILTLTHFSEDIKKTFSNIDVHVQIDIEKRVLTFKGISGDITSAKVSMYETVNNIASVHIGSRSPSFIRFLNYPEVVCYVENKMKEKNVIGVWEIQDNNIAMHSTSKEEAAASEILKENVIATKITVGSLQHPVLLSPKWTQFIRDIEDEYQRMSVFTKVVVANQGQIMIFCTTIEEADRIQKQIQDFCIRNTEHERIVTLPPAELKFLHEQMKDEVAELEHKLKQKHVLIAVKSNSILIKGNEQGIKYAEDNLESLVKTIYKTRYSLDRPGLQEYINSEFGQRKLKRVGKDADVLINTEGDENEATGRYQENRVSEGTSDGQNLSSMQVKIFKGELARMKVRSCIKFWTVQAVSILHFPLISLLVVLIESF